jgi:PAS domain S-box-containing protein
LVIDTRAQPQGAFLERLRRWLVLGNGVIAAVLLGLVVQWQADILKSEQDNERSRLQGLALSISQTIAGQMDLVDLGLQSVAQQLQAMEGRTGPVRAEQVNAMLAAQRSQAWAQASQDGVHILDPSGTIVRASASLAGMLGYHPDYLQGRSLSLLSTLALQDLLAHPHGPHGAVRKLQTQYRRLDGSLLAVELYVTTVLFATGPLLYCSARDISRFLTNSKEEP